MLKSLWLKKKIDELVGAEKMSCPLDFLKRYDGRQQPQTAFCGVRFGVRNGEIS